MEKGVPEVNKLYLGAKNRTLFFVVWFNGIWTERWSGDTINGITHFMEIPKLEEE